ncbi:alpha/beta fold hydrolase [Paraferrimonas sp. SM1919]|uniref:alpha/beta fold hydrolase n=1 Tax=Paraferrimonas sp. SM1919 TaxID=2662263 RepID=UPI0013D6D147|nr:alpha/beta hydrolase [Paraferrimonas sp. SM1919]
MILNEFPRAYIERELPLAHRTLSAIHYDADTDKPLLICLHGWLDNAMSFVPLAQHLDEYQLLVVEWPGHGHCGHRDGSYGYHWIDYIFDLHCLMQEYQGKAVAIVAHSLGGLISRCYAANYPLDIPMVLIEAIEPIWEKPEQASARLKRSFRQQLKQLQRDPHKTYELAPLVKLRSDKSDLPEALCEILLRRNMIKTDKGYIWRSDNKLRLDSVTRMSYEQQQSLNSSVNSPVCLIVGASGYQEVKMQYVQYKSKFTDLTQVTIAGGHHCHMSHPQQCADVIKGFLG